MKVVHYSSLSLSLLSMSMTMSSSSSLLLFSWNVYNVFNLFLFFQQHNFCFFNNKTYFTDVHQFFYIQTVNIQKTPCYIHILSYGMERQSNELCYDSLRLFWYVGSKTNNITRNTRKFFFQIYSMKCEIFKFPTFNRTNSVPTLRM